MFAAVSNTDVIGIKNALDEGADPSICSHNGDMPLHMLARIRSMKAVNCARELLSYGQSLSSRNMKGLSVLQVARRVGNEVFIDVFTCDDESDNDETCYYE